MKKYSLVILASLVVVAGSLRYLSSLARVTANVSGRELPIYSVAVSYTHLDVYKRQYVRFASVYREFKDVNTFMEEIKKFLDK